MNIVSDQHAVTAASPSAGVHHAFLSLFQGPMTGMDVLILIGFAGQIMFFMRFFVQWIASERAGKSVVPETFWYFSLAGGVILTFYAYSRHDPVFLLGQGVGLFIYIRNIMLVHQNKKLRAGESV